MSYIRVVARLIARQVILHEVPHEATMSNSPNEWLINPALRRRRYYLFFVVVPAQGRLDTLFISPISKRVRCGIFVRKNSEHFDLLPFPDFRVLIFEFPPSRAHLFKWVIEYLPQFAILPVSLSLSCLCASLTACMPLYYPRCILEPSVEAIQRVAAAPARAVGLKFPPATMRRSRASMIVPACSHSCSTLHACLDAGVIQVAPLRRTRRDRAPVHVKFACNNSELESC